MDRFFNIDFEKLCKYQTLIKSNSVDKSLLSLSSKLQESDKGDDDFDIDDVGEEEEGGWNLIS